MPEDWLLRIGNGVHFNASSSKSIWGINTTTSPFGKYFMSNVKEGDRLWFVTSKSKGQIVAVSTFMCTKERVLGPLLDLTATNKELGWTVDEGDWNTEVHYKDLYNLTEYKMLSEIKCPSTIRRYDEKCKVNLPVEYPYIVRYCKPTSNGIC
jgi:hypothetical protein